MLSRNHAISTWHNVRFWASVLSVDTAATGREWEGWRSEDRGPRGCSRVTGVKPYIQPSAKGRVRDARGADHPHACAPGPTGNADGQRTVIPYLRANQHMSLAS